MHGHTRTKQNGPNAIQQNRVPAGLIELEFALERYRNANAMRNRPNAQMQTGLGSVLVIHPFGHIDGAILAAGRAPEKPRLRVVERDS